MKKIFQKIVCLLFGGFLVALAALVNIDTHSYFSQQVAKNLAVTAATTEDIIKKFIIPNNERNPQVIRVQKAEGLNSNPVIYFEVGGEAANYLLHINPVKLSSEEEIVIDLNLNINFKQIMKLCQSNNSLVTGTISLKYLNEFIDEEIPIIFTRRFLIDTYWDLILDSDRNRISDLITYVAQYKTWQEVEWVTVDKKEVELTEDQAEIVDIVVPKLRKYIYQLSETVVSLLKELDKKNLQIAEQDFKIKNLIESKSALEKTKAEMADRNVQLLEKIDTLGTEKNDLEERVAALKGDKSDLKKEKRRLKEIIEDLQDKLNKSPKNNDEEEEEPGEQTGTDSDEEEEENPGEQTGTDSDEEEEEDPGEQTGVDSEEEEEDPGEQTGTGSDEEEEEEPGEQTGADSDEEEEEEPGESNQNQLSIQEQGENRYKDKTVV